jgi:hypothetical protein
MKMTVKLTLGAVIACAGALFITLQAHSAEIASCGPWDQYRTENPVAGVPRCETRLWFSGKIVRGDYDRLHEFLRREGKNVLEIVLQKSPGGDVDESIKIGRLIRRLKLQTKIAVSVPPVDPFLEGSTITDDNATCASACVLVWMAGIMRQGNWRLVVHRPYFDPTYFAGLSADEADQRYRELEQQAYDYLREMDAPESLIRAMREVPSTDGKILDRKYVRDELGTVIPSYDEWQTAKCGRLSVERWVDLLSKRAQGTKLTAEEQKLLDQEKAIRDCRLKVLIQAHKEAWTAEFE